jgi:hypothetical protein
MHNVHMKIISGEEATQLVERHPAVEDIRFWPHRLRRGREDVFLVEDAKTKGNV